MRFLDGELRQTRGPKIVDGGSEYHLLTDGTHLYLEVLGEGDLGHPEKFEPADSGISERGVTAGSGRDCLRKGEYFGNVA
jgi:hypothetical protein